MKLEVRWLAGVLAASALLGCGPTTQSQLTRCKDEKKTLLTRIVDEQKRADALASEKEQLAARLADSEKQLARLYQQSSGRYVSASSSYPANSPAPPSVPPTGVSAERPARVIPLGSPGIGGPALTAPNLSPAASRDRVERREEPNELAAGQPSLAPPGNGRSESGWLPKAGAVPPSPRR